MFPSTFNNIDFVKIDVSNMGVYDKNVYDFSKNTVKIGEVEYFYRISKYPITNKLYNCFLEYDGKEKLCKEDNLPVVNISYIDMCYYCNWLSTGDKNEGPYAITKNKPLLLTKNGFYIPNLHEWHKAAFYDPYKKNYFLYATSSNDAPKKCSEMSLEKNVSNYLFIERTEDSLLKKNYEKNYKGRIINVCSFINTLSPFGTYDQNGNVWEMVDSEFGEVKYIKGGSAFSSLYSLRSTFCSVVDVNIRSEEIGFRVCRGF